MAYQKHGMLICTQKMESITRCSQKTQRYPFFDVRRPAQQGLLSIDSFPGLVYNRRDGEEPMLNERLLEQITLNPRIMN